ncbi:anti-sigma factor family protein, partial [Archangium sp.]|uniref:anti-sigma factor family protein n=1 Tax=Archangium sp. TaxID=1872627 RepID=UPI002ED80071
MSDIDIHDNVHAFADGELEPAEAEAFRDHLGTCERCQTELDDILQLQVLGSQLSEQGATLPMRPVEPTAPPSRAFRPAWSRRRVGLAVALGGSLAAAVTLAVLSGPGKDMPGTVSSEALALAPTRSLEARLSYEGAAGYRPYGVMRSGNEQPRETVPLKTLTRMEEKGDFHGLAIGALLGGDREQAVSYLQQASGSPDVECDRAVLALSKGELEQALTLLDGVLEKTPKHPQALWNRGLVLRELGLESLAAESFRQVAALGEPGWSEEARERADALERQGRERRGRWEAAGRAGRALVEQGTPLPEGTVRDAPSLVRGYLYLAAWSSPTAERVRALLPVARELDALQGNGVLQKYVEDTARRDFRKRGPLAATFTKVLAGQLAPAEAEAWLQQLQAAGQQDLLLGALPLMTQLPARLPEYEAAAREVGDPWFAANAELHRARGQLAAGQLAEARATLVAALPTCEQQRLDSRCVEMEALASRVSLAEKKPAEARERALRGLNRARALGDAGLELQFIQLLGESARLGNAPAL